MQIYTKKVGNINLSMIKPTAIALVFLFSLTALLSGASGDTDCAAKCAYEMAKAHQHASMGSTRLAATNCCSKAVKNTCEMDRTAEIKIPECSMASHVPVFPKPIGVGFLPGDAEADRFQPSQFNLGFGAAETKSKRPIYLETLSILC
jgi:hypothetical protein